MRKTSGGACALQPDTSKSARQGIVRQRHGNETRANWPPRRETCRRTGGRCSHSAAVWVCSWRIRYFARLDGRSLRSWKKITGFCFYHVNGRDDWGPWDLGQTIALRPDTQTQTDDNNASMRLSRNRTVGHCTAPQKAASPQASLRR